jgi:uncharacterized protein
MKVYFRDSYLSRLNELHNADESTFTVIRGPRQVGKTTLVKQYLKKNEGVYLTISSKSTYLQLRDIADHLKHFPFIEDVATEFASWREFFDYIFTLSREKSVDVIIDELQNLELVEPEAYEDLRDSWRKHSKEGVVRVMALLSDGDFVKAAFDDQESPLYRINTHEIALKPFRLSEVMAIFRHNGSTLSSRDVATLYLVFGGLPKYYFLIERFGLWKRGVVDILKELVFIDFAPLGYELKDLVINDFSRGNKIYLSILQAIANGKTRMSEIARAIDIPVTNLTKYLFELEKKKSIIRRELPVSADREAFSKFGRYALNNAFHNFWFRFVQPEIISYEMGMYERITDSLGEKLHDYYDERLPRLIREIVEDYADAELIADLFPHPIDKVGGVWNRKETIDLAVVSEKDKAVLLGVAHDKREAVTGSEAVKYIDALERFASQFDKYQRRLILVARNGLQPEAEAQCRDRGVEVAPAAYFTERVINSETPARDEMVEIGV